MVSTGLISALLASSCCIIPVLAIIAGSTGMASTFAWVAPFRPYLMLLSISVLSFAWYQQLREKKTPDDCCAVSEKPRFLQSNIFLAILTVFALTMMAFPLYSNIFFKQSAKHGTIMNNIDDFQQIEFKISGMTCAGCEDHIEHAVNRLPGIIEVSASHDKANTIIRYNPLIVSRKAIEVAVSSTGYSIITTDNN